MFLRYMLFFVLCANVAHGQITPGGDYTIHFKDEATLTAPEGGDLYFWQIPPALSNTATIPNAVILKGPAGRYQISVSIITADWETKKFDQRNLSLAFVLGSDPDPDPDPKPGPDPGPEPEPGKYGFDTASWTHNMTDGSKYKTAIADNFDAVAGAIAAGAIKTVSESQSELAQRNRDAVKGTIAIGEWTQFFQKWQDKATELNTSKKLRNLVEDYAEAYRESAKGLR